MNAKPQYHAIIIGGGPVGGLMACALGTAGLSVAVVEAAEPQTLCIPGTDGRAIALALSAQRVFVGSQVWPFMQDHAQPILDIKVTNGASPFFLHYDHQALGQDPFGWIVENPVIRGAVHQRMAQLPTVSLYAPCQVATMVRDATAATVTLTDGRVLTADILIAADGRRSATRSMAGIGLTRWDYYQSGIVCALAHEKPHHGLAHEHFLPSGPFAILPMRDTPNAEPRSALVWTEKVHLADAIVAQDAADFQAEAAERIEDRLGAFRLDSPRYHYPLSLQFADRAVDQRLVLIGDAAHGMHPIAGQGMNMGIRDVAALAEVLVDQARLGLDIGSPLLLKRYERWRRFDNMLMLGMTDVLNRLFSNNNALLSHARSLGLAAVNAVPPVKRLFMRHAMGVVGDLPRLLRGEPL